MYAHVHVDCRHQREIQASIQHLKFLLLGAYYLYINGDGVGVGGQNLPTLQGGGRSPPPPFPTPMIHRPIHTYIHLYKNYVNMLLLSFLNLPIHMPVFIASLASTVTTVSAPCTSTKRPRPHRFLQCPPPPHESIPHRESYGGS